MILITECNICVNWNLVNVWPWGDCWRLPLHKTNNSLITLSDKEIHFLCSRRTLTTSALFQFVPILVCSDYIATLTSLKIIKRPISSWMECCWLCPGRQEAGLSLLRFALLYHISIALLPVVAWNILARAYFPEDTTCKLVKYSPFVPTFVCVLGSSRWACRGHPV